MSPTIIGIIGIIALFVLIFSRMPVGFLMAIFGFLGFASIVSMDASLNLLAKDMFSVFGSYNLTVIPLFVLMGQIAFHSGISKRLFDTAYTFIGHIPAGSPSPPLGPAPPFPPSAAPPTQPPPPWPLPPARDEAVQLQARAGHRRGCRGEASAS